MAALTATPIIIIMTMTDSATGSTANADRINTAVERRRVLRREEWNMQTQVAELLKRHLPPGCFATALDNKPRSARSGHLAKLRGTRAGIPDWEFVWRGETIWIELKSHKGIASKVQRQIRDELLAAGVKWWWLARSPRACLMALHLSGVPLIGWKPPSSLERWAGPFQNPYARLPQHPATRRERAEAQQRYRVGKEMREREAALRAAAGGVPSTPNGGGAAAGPVGMARIAAVGGIAVPPGNISPIPPPATAVNTATKKPHSTVRHLNPGRDRHRDPNRDRHRPGYMAAYMRRRRAAASQARDLGV
jgi:hypothetical protein